MAKFKPEYALVHPESFRTQEIIGHSPVLEFDIKELQPLPTFVEVGDELNATVGLAKAIVDMAAEQSSETSILKGFEYF
jgi:hypothetical protein